MSRLKRFGNKTDGAKEGIPKTDEKTRLAAFVCFWCHFRSAAIRVLGEAQPVGRGFAAHPKGLFSDLICCAAKLPDVSGAVLPRLKSL